MSASEKALVLVTLAALLAACNSNPDRTFELAEACWRDGDYKEAVRLNRLAYDQDPQGEIAAQALLNLGKIYYLNLRQLDMAIQAFNRVVESFPGSTEEYEARCSLAEIYSDEIGDLTQAISEYDIILDSGRAENPDEIRLKRANAYFKKEDFHEALPELRRLEESGLEGHLSDQVALKIGMIYLINKRFEEARDAFERVTQSDSEEFRNRAIKSLVETYENLYDFDRAIEIVQKLSPVPEYEEYIESEVTRLREKRRRIESGEISPDGENNRL